MKILCLGGAGKICGEAVRDLAAYSDFERITIGDVNGAAAEELISVLGDSRLDFRHVDVMDRKEAISVMRDYDIVMDGTTIHLNDASTACIAEAGCHGINLNGFGEEYKYDAIFRRNGKTHVPGFGMTPGVTDMMVRSAADRLDTVEIVRVSHGAFRPIAFSPSITETTTFEYDPDLPGRVVFEEGEFIQVPPFSRQRDIELPPPYGTLPQWIIPHSETRTAYEYLKNKGIRLIEVRGTWPPENMQLIRALYDWGFLRNETVSVNGTEVGIMDAVSAYLQQSEKGRTTRLYGYALHVQVIGEKDGRRREHVLTHTHPPSDGSVPDWEGLRAYTRCVGIPISIGAQRIAGGEAGGTGVVMPEFAFAPEPIFRELEKRDIRVHERISEI